MDLAIQAGLVDNVRLLLAKGFDIRMKDGSLLDQTIEEYGDNHIEFKGVTTMISVLLGAGAEVNEETYSGETFLDRMEIRGADDLVVFLKAHGARHGSGALRESVRAKDIRRVAQLIVAKANADAPDRDGQTAMHIVMDPEWGISDGRYFLGLLMDLGARINAEDLDGHTPLDLGVRNRRDELVAFLLAHGAKRGSGMSRRPLQFGGAFDQYDLLDLPLLDELVPGAAEK